jgi:aminoglycoside phosphotransferase (APT) family kinase protein
MNKTYFLLLMNEVGSILLRHRHRYDRIDLFQKNDRVSDYLIDNKFIFRVSKNELDEESRLVRIKSLRSVSHIHFSGQFFTGNQMYHYILIDYIDGEELFGLLPYLSNELFIDIGKSMADFLVRLHSIQDSLYDIGHYIPTIKRYNGTWQSGHEAYIYYLENTLAAIQLKDRSKSVIRDALAAIRNHMHVLSFQTGPVFLHNDFHPKNVIIRNSKFNGVIDWECSQFGERDFDLIHFIHWSIYPHEGGRPFEQLLKSFLQTYLENYPIPDIDKRLWIYQLEHEMMQIIWNHKRPGQEEDRIDKLEGWLLNHNDLSVYL